MKELSIEEKARRYDEILARAEGANLPYYKEDIMSKVKEFVDYLIPELKESEDEKIRQFLIHEVTETSDEIMSYRNMNKKDVLAWLEKQGEKKPIVSDDALREGIAHFGITQYQIDNWLKKYVDVEKQGEQKPIDMVEPKFKIEKGKWYVCIRDLLDNYANKAFRKGDIYLSTQDGSLIPSNSNVPFEVACPDIYFRDWTIQDAKDGDVLFTLSTASHETFLFKSIDEKGNAKCYFAYDSEDGFREGKYHFIGSATNCKPATKEQCNLFFQKMKEVGYEWDAEKKELRKFPTPADVGFEELGKAWAEEAKDKKSAWSEEDETTKNNISHIIREYDKISKRENQPCYYVGDCLLWMQNIKERLQPQPKQEWGEEDERIRQDIENLIHFALRDGSAVSPAADTTKEDAISWIQSLRPQKTWKPSDEQIKVCKEVYADLLSAKGFDLGTVNSELNRLEEQLKTRSYESKHTIR